MTGIKTLVFSSQSLDSRSIDKAMSDAQAIAMSLTAGTVTDNSDPLERFTEQDFKTLLAIADAFVPPVDPQALKPYVAKNAYAPTDSELEEFARLSPSGIREAFFNCIRKTLIKVPAENRRQLILVVKLLSHRSTALLLTKSSSLLSEMSLEDREQVLLSWSQSRLANIRKLHRSLFDMSTATFTRSTNLSYKAFGHPYTEPRLNDPDVSTKEIFKHSILDLGEYATSTEISVDVVIIGSGSGGGVAANRLAHQGYSVLVLEKGTYYHETEFNFNEDDGHANLYEQGGALITDDGSMLVLSGATLGGGSTVNWSASLRTADVVRKEWVEKGVEWYGTSVYDEAMDYVMEKMGCHTNNLEHSFSNQLILDGAAKLGYSAKEIDQNTGGAAHKCGFCSFGCRFGEKQGSVVCWLRDAAQHGNCKIIDKTDVIKIVHTGKKATGVEAVVHKHGRDISLFVKAKKVVVSGGSLQTPGVLLRSGFKNKTIGHGLKLHPVTVVFGDFPEVEQNPFEKPIMTAVCTEVDNLDGKGHGPKIESVLHQPLLEAHFLPWKSGKQYRQEQIRYNHTSALLVITRDKGSGRVYYTKDDPLRPRLDYLSDKYDSWALMQGVLASADLLYIQGAARILSPLPLFPIFVPSVEPESRNINDSDYQRWRSKLSKHSIEPVRVPMGSAHQMASCSLGGKPDSSVANPRGQLWECDNVYIADASALPTASGVNPMISTMATAHVVAGHIIQDLRSADSRL
ncbi:hypothetical protein AWJ20_1550 [Sugiyamaella lignohabitans]|uniref:Long-chain-alcohol oxidase n=1 Tax=Sugiyamaella lignohabitans TaxID=796027 RepID=A0A167DT63_9ASCO|nr:uncharacterized protein AWJ20_1550 [Sugiyamaella lignohabitans]ANB13266.1 hypothetical protein AWJ20_1550 [Sugiyamaella lignohabitans]